MKLSTLLNFVSVKINSIFSVFFSLLEKMIFLNNITSFILLENIIEQYYVEGFKYIYLKKG